MAFTGANNLLIQKSVLWTHTETCEIWVTHTLIYDFPMKRILFFYIIKCVSLKGYLWKTLWPHISNSINIFSWHVSNILHHSRMINLTATFVIIVYAVSNRGSWVWGIWELCITWHFGFLNLKLFWKSEQKVEFVHNFLMHHKQGCFDFILFKHLIKWKILYRRASRRKEHHRQIHDEELNSASRQYMQLETAVWSIGGPG